MPVYAGAAYQRGHGLGRVMKSILRHATPILKQAGKQALKTGLSALASGVVGNRRTNARSRNQSRISPNRKNVVTKRVLNKTRKAKMARDIFSYK